MINTNVYKTVQGTGADAPTAVTAGNLAMATFLATTDVYNPSFPPQILNSGMFSDATTGDYTAWWTVFYRSAS